MSDENISGGFKQLGENLAGLLRAAWDRPEREKIQKDIEAGLNDLGEALNRAADDIAGSDFGKKVQADLAGWKEKIEKGDAEEKVRGEIRTALGSVNTELEKLIRKLREE
jgi:hypothetical protein